MNGQQLKNSILQMAVQGKLVPQDPNDEPASVLIQRIREEKEKLIKEKKIKKEKNTSYIFRGSDNLHYEKNGDAEPVCVEDQIPFEIPGSWEWGRISLISYLVGNKNNQIQTKSISVEGCIPVVSQGNKLIDGYSDAVEKKIQDLPLVMFGDHTRNVKYVDFPFVIGADGTKFHKILVCHPKYIYYWMYLSASKLKNRGYARHYSLLDQLFIPLPPLSEQERIVAKIETLLPHIDEYNTKASELLVLNDSFPEKLKKSILQEAVQGKLVPQDPSEEPASALLERIREEKARLVKEGMIKKDKNESVIFRRDNSYYEKSNGIERCIDEEIPFEIPDSWEWVRLGNVCKIARGGSPRPIKQYLTESPDGINWIKIGDTDKDSKYINSTKEKIIVEGVTKSRLVHKGDFLLTNSMSFGRPYILNIDGCIHDGWLMLSNYQTVYDKDFLYYMLSSRFAYYQFCGVVSGAVVKNLNTDKVEISLMPLPPLAEQQRIVAKIEQFFAMIKGL